MRSPELEDSGSISLAWRSAKAGSRGGDPQTLQARDPFRTWRKSEATQKAISHPPLLDFATTS